MIGETIQNYIVTAKIGEGGMGAVYLAHDNLLDRQVAIKILHPRLVQDETLMERFKNEAKTLARLNHPNIATLYSLVQHDVSLCMVLEYVDGVTVEALLSKYSTLPPGLAANLSCQVLDGLQYAHTKDIVHRDIKPANLMVTRDGTLKIMDFGIARVIGSSRSTRVGSAIGTLEYMSPEQIRGEEVTPSSDIYSLGIVLYEMLSGKPPFKSDSEYNLMQSQINQRPAPLRFSLPNIPDALNNAVLKALEKDQAKRFAHAGAFRQALVQAVPVTISFPDFEAAGLNQLQATQVITSFVNPTTVSNNQTAQASRGASWFENVLENGSSAKKIFFIAAAVVILFLTLEIVCSRQKEQPEIANTASETTIADKEAQIIYQEERQTEDLAEQELNTGEMPTPNIPTSATNTARPDKKTAAKSAEKTNVTASTNTTQAAPQKTPQPSVPAPAAPSYQEPAKPEPPKSETTQQAQSKQEQPKHESEKIQRYKNISIGHNHLISVAPRKTIRAADLSPGKMLDMEVISSFFYDGVLVIEKGASLMARVTEVNPSNFKIELLHVQTTNKNLVIDIHGRGNDPNRIRTIKTNVLTTNDIIKKVELKKTKDISIPY